MNVTRCWGQPWADVSLRHVPAGRLVPGSQHSVSVSIPDIATVAGFESGNEATLKRIAWGYPRFRTHPYVRQVAGLISQSSVTPGRGAVLTRSARLAEAAAAYAGLGPEATFCTLGVHGVRLTGDHVCETRIRDYVQHTGGHLSSREAEDVLVDAGLLDTWQPEAALENAPADVIKAVLADAYGAHDAEDVSLHNSGMNAIAAAIAAVSDSQRENGRRRWVQLGWIFFDTVRLLKKRIIDVEYETISDPFDLTEIERVTARHAGKVAGIIAEIPSNPGLQVPDVPALREIADRSGCALVLDSTIATPHNVDVLRYADVVCESLTKFATGSADVLMGAAIVNAGSPFAPSIRDGLRRFGDEPYHRDMARVAARIRDYGERIKRVNTNTIALAEYLERQNIVKRVNWAYDARSRDNYRKVERVGDAPGGLLMVDLQVPLELVYDHLPVAKGPSFGAEFTMAAAQIFIAHFDLLSTAAGRAELRSHGLHRDMLRVSVGVEEPERIVETFQRAFQPARTRVTSSSAG